MDRSTSFMQNCISQKQTTTFLFNAKRPQVKWLGCNRCKVSIHCSRKLSKSQTDFSGFVILICWKLKWFQTIGRTHSHTNDSLQSSTQIQLANVNIKIHIFDLDRNRISLLVFLVCLTSHTRLNVDTDEAGRQDEDDGNRMPQTRQRRLSFVVSSVSHHRRLMTTTYGFYSFLLSKDFDKFQFEFSSVDKRPMADFQFNFVSK